MKPHTHTSTDTHSSSSLPCEEAAPAQPMEQMSRYVSQKWRDWNSFLRFLREKRPPVEAPDLCSGAHVIEFLRYMDQFGKTKVHSHGCVFYGHAYPTGPCSCPLRQAWGSLDALTGRLRAAHDESGGVPDANPFAARVVRAYLRELRESQARARGISYKKKKRWRQHAAAGPSPPHTRERSSAGERSSSHRLSGEVSSATGASTSLFHARLQLLQRQRT